MAAFAEGDESAGDAPGVPYTEATGRRGFVGVMYLKLSPLDGGALGVSADLHEVQLNARFAPTSAVERELQYLFSGLVMAVNGEKPDEKRASAFVEAINKTLKG